MRVGVLLLAAGRSRRFGFDKRVAMMPGGCSVIDTTLEQVRRSGLPLRVCLDVGDEFLAHDLTEKGFQVYRCVRAAEGMGGTLAEGISRLPDWDGILVALADMPWIAPATFQLVAGSLTPSAITIPVYAGQRGHPVGFGRQYWPELESLSGDVGARSIVQKHRGAVQELEVSDKRILHDIDESSDL